MLRDTAQQLDCFHLHDDEFVKADGPWKRNGMARACRLMFEAYVLNHRPLLKM